MHRFALFLGAFLVLRCSAEPALGRDGRGAADPASWMHRYEGTASVQRSLMAALPGGGFVAGVQGAQEAPNAIVVMDARGNVKASRKLNPYELSCLTAGPDGSIFAGIRSPDHQSGTMRLVKFRADLSVAWTRRFTTAEGEPVGMGRAAGTRDGGLAVIGGHAGASIVAKLNRDGAVEWATGIDASDVQGLERIRQTRDGGYVAAGSSPRWAWLVKLGADGAVLWQRAYGPRSGSLSSVIESQDGTFVAIGSFANKPMIMKTTGRGEVVWSKVPASPGSGLSLEAAGEAAGEAGGEQGDAIATMSAGEMSDTIQIVSIRPDGSLRWQRSFQPGGGILWNEFENATLAVTKGQVAFAVAQGTELAIFAGSVAGGPGGCAWFSDGKVALTDVTLREEEVTVERFRPRLVAKDAAVQFAPLEVRAVAESCPPAAPTWSDLHPVPKRPELAFRVPDTSALTKIYAALLVEGEFAELEELAAKLRKDKPSPDPLRPNLALRTFYQAFENNEAAPVKARLARLREWRAAHPQSVTARIALAGALYRAAWDIRGGDTSDTVTASAGEAYDAMLDEARRVLAGLGDDVDDPYYWYVRVHLTHELGLGDVRAVGLKALARYPDPLIASRVARYLYPQWGGSPEMYMQFADDATRVTKARYGEAMYLWLVSQITNWETSDDYKQYPTDWSRVLQGGEDLIRMNPDWPPSYHFFAKLARKYDDEETLRSLFQRPQLEWYEGADQLWNDRELYEDVRRNALPAPPVPVVVPPQQPSMDATPPPAVAPRPVPPNIARAPLALLESEVTVGGNVQRNLSAFLVATTEGVVAVSADPEPFSQSRLLDSWTLWSAADGKKRTHTGPFLTANVSSSRRGVAMRLESKAPAGVQPLKPAREQPRFSDPVFVIVCRRPHGRCEETALAATLISRNDSPGMVTHELELADPPAENEAIGAAVVNERREVFAVVTLRMTDPRWPGQVKFEAESLASVIPGL